MKPLSAFLAFLWMAFMLPATAQENDVKSFDVPVGDPIQTPRLAVGPDAFGYTAADETEATGPMFDFIDISGTGTSTGLNGDDVGTGALAIGFSFDFYGTSYTELAASTNGYLNFNPTGDLSDFGNDCPGLNAFDPDQSIYALWDDLAIDAGVGDFYYQTFPVCPNDSGGFGACAIFQWEQVRHLGDTDLFDFQAILYDTNNILIQLGEGEPEAGAGATIGIENQAPSSIGLDYACNTAGSMPANRGVLFCAPGNICPAPDYTVGGTVSGLDGMGLVLQNNASDDLAVNMNGSFVFPTALPDGSDFEVSVLTQPTGLSQTCTVTNGDGTLAGADVTNVEVNCVTDQFTVGGTVSGLAGTGLVLQNNGGDDQAIIANGPFTFSPQDDGSVFAVTVLSQPTSPSQTCTVTNDSGSFAGADVTNVEVSCVTDQFTVGGTVSGLTGTGLVLQNNGGDDQAIVANGPFTFSPQDDGTAYAVSVLSQPSLPDQECTLNNPSGSLNGADVTDVSVDCVEFIIGLSTNDLELGQVFIGGSGAATIIVSNPGTADLILTDISMPASPFGLLGGTCLNLPVTLQASETCTLDVEFSPESVDSFSDQIVITSNAASSPDTINLSGQGIFEPQVVPTLDVWGLLILMLMFTALTFGVFRHKAYA